jgi:hypothetical protein
MFPHAPGQAQPQVLLAGSSGIGMEASVGRANPNSRTSTSTLSQMTSSRFADLRYANDSSSLLDLN